MPRSRRPVAIDHASQALINLALPLWIGDALDECLRPLFYSNQEEHAIRRPFKVAHNVGELIFVESPQGVGLKDLHVEVLGHGYQVA